MVTLGNIHNLWIIKPIGYFKYDLKIKKLIN